MTDESMPFASEDQPIDLHYAGTHFKVWAEAAEDGAVWVIEANGVRRRGPRVAPPCETVFDVPEMVEGLWDTGRGKFRE
jgi:hypothetical protein